jgi:hypothetical protein
MYLLPNNLYCLSTQFWLTASKAVDLAENGAEKVIGGDCVHFMSATRAELPGNWKETASTP